MELSMLSAVWTDGPLRSLGGNEHFAVRRDCPTGRTGGMRH